MQVCMENTVMQLSQLQLQPTIMNDIKRAQQETKDERFRRLMEKAQARKIPGYEMSHDGMLSYKGRAAVPKGSSAITEIL